MHDNANKTRTGLFIAGGLLAANVIDAAFRSQAYNHDTFTNLLQTNLIIDAGILPACSAYYLVKHL